MVPSKVPSFLSSTYRRGDSMHFHPSCSATGLHSLKPISATYPPPGPIGRNPYDHISTQFQQAFHFKSLYFHQALRDNNNETYTLSNDTAIVCSTQRCWLREEADSSTVPTFQRSPLFCVIPNRQVSTIMRTVWGFPNLEKSSPSLFLFVAFG